MLQSCLPSNNPVRVKSKLLSLVSIWSWTRNHQEWLCSFCRTWIYTHPSRCFITLLLHQMSHLSMWKEVCRTGKRDFSLLWHCELLRADPCWQRRKMLHQFILRLTAFASHTHAKFSQFCDFLFFHKESSSSKYSNSLKECKPPPQISRSLRKTAGLCFLYECTALRGSLWTISMQAVIRRHQKNIYSEINLTSTFGLHSFPVH